MDRPRLAVFVDAGYLRGVGAQVHQCTADQVQIVPVKLINWVRGIAGYHGQLLRTYVYDGQFDSAHPRYPDQERHLEELADIAGIRVRRGALVDRGGKGVHQKGVDTLLVIDMLQMAQLNAFDTAVLFAGDADFTEAVDVVQRFGRSALVVRVDPPDIGLAKSLRQAADDFIWITTGTIRDIVCRVEHTA